MDSKELLETFGISKKFSIILFIQSIIVIIGCFFAIQDMYFCIKNEISYVAISDVINLLLFIFLIYYSFIGFRKDEKYFKIAVYLFILSVLVTLFTNIGYVNINHYIPILGNLVIFILLCYFIYNLNNYNKAKLIIISIVICKLIIWISMGVFTGLSIEMNVIRLIHIIPCVSVALTYIARYNKDGFKRLN